MRKVFCALIDHTELSELIEAANRAEDDKNAFIAMLSNELRNPLSPILSAGIVMKKVANDSQVSKMAEIVERQAKRLVKFVNHLLHAANLAQGGATQNDMRAELSEVMQAATDSLTALAESRGRMVEIEPWPGAIFLCNAERLSQAVSNVMPNASEFTGRGGHIAAMARVEGATLRIKIKDDGIGISPAHLDDIFKPDIHFATHAERSRVGAPLGSALAKDICQKHGDSISASSQGPGRGSLFALSLPIVVDKPV